MFGSFILWTCHQRIVVIQYAKRTKRIQIDTNKNNLVLMNLHHDKKRRMQYTKREEIFMRDDLLSAQEVANILKVSRNTVYEFIKRGELKASKVGKQVRISKKEVDSYLLGTNADDTPSPVRHSPSFSSGTNGLSGTFTYSPPIEENVRGNEFVICGQDLSLDILANHLNTLTDSLQVYRSYLGSYNGIYALYQGRVHVATSHLWDGDLDEYNVPYVKKMMPGIPALIMRIGKRQHGFYVKPGNPKGIRGWTDLKRKDITIVNREKGSGTRVLLDEKLRLVGMIGDYINGYSKECKSHLAVATQVFRGEADIGLGSETGSKTFKGIDFIPLQTECYDLIIRLADADKHPYRTILEIIASDAFKLDLESVGGYDTDETGKIIWQ
jgi:putative molybdopterin biosynthesis protein